MELRDVEARIDGASEGRCLPNGIRGELLADDVISDGLTPRLLKDQSIYTQWQVVDLNPANSVRSRVRRGNPRSARAKLREGFAVLLLVCLGPHLTVKSSLLR